MHLIALGAVALASPAYSAPATPPVAAYHMVTTFARRVQCVRDVTYDAPSVSALQYSIVAPFAPDTDSQSVVADSITVDGFTGPTVHSCEKSPENR